MEDKIIRVAEITFSKGAILVLARDSISTELRLESSHNILKLFNGDITHLLDAEMILQYNADLKKFESYGSFDAHISSEMAEKLIHAAFDHIVKSFMVNAPMSPLKPVARA